MKIIFTALVETAKESGGGKGWNGTSCGKRKPKQRTLPLFSKKEEL